MMDERSDESALVPKKSNASRRGRRGSPAFALLVLVLLAAAAGWWLLTPHRHAPPEQQVGEVVPAVTAPPSETPLPVESPTELPASPSPTPIAVPPSPAPPSPRASPRAAPSYNPGAPKLALIVDDCGQWIDTERAFVALDVPLTLSVLPDVHYTATIANEAAQAGKGVMLHLPMETVSGLNPGPGKVTTEMTDAAITAQVEADLAQVPLAGGVNNHEGSKGSADPRVMRDVMDVLAKRGNLFFIDSRTSSASVGERTAQAQGVPTAGRDVFLDNQASVAYAEAQLRDAAAIAKRTGSAIAIGHPRATTLEAVRAMIPQLQAEGIQFVLARDLVSGS
jgi:polysaccharide deacetylase 2 family uncharacterized protein YibQ